MASLMALLERSVLRRGNSSDPSVVKVLVPTVPGTEVKKLENI